MTRSEIEAHVLTIVCNQKGLGEASIALDQPLREMGFDSLDALNVMFALEETFGISIADEEALRINSIGSIADLVEGHLQSSR